MNKRIRKEETEKQQAEGREKVMKNSFYDILIHLQIPSVAQITFYRK